MPKKQAFIDKSGVKFVENFQKNQKIKKFPSRTEIRYLTAFMQKSRGDLAADYLNQFVQQVKASGEVQQILDANQAQGAIVAK